MSKAAERRVKRRLRHLLPALADKAITAEKMDAGLSAQAVYRIKIEGKREHIFVRVGKFDPAVSVRSSNDSQHMRVLMASLGLSAKILATASNFNVDEFVRGGVLRIKDLEHRVFWKKLGLLLASIHRCPADGFFTQTPMLLDRVQELLENEDVPNLLKPGISSAATRWPSKGLAASLVPCHNDIHPDNILKGRSSLLVTDFEDSGINFAGYDIAYLFNSIAMYREMDFTGYPSFEERESFAKSYLQVMESSMTTLEFLLDVEKYAPEMLLLEGVFFLTDPDPQREPDLPDFGRRILDCYPAACRALTENPQRLIKEGAWAIAANGYIFDQ